MVERVIDFAAHNKFIVLILTAVAVAMAFYAMQHVPLDAIPDLSDTQVIVYSRWDRSPDIMEDQVTYPIITALLGAPKVKAIRGFSDFGFSYVYIIFEDGTDLYWARSRTLEYLSKILPRLPEGVRTEMGPDATGVGWVYQYALVDRSGKHDLAELRSFQDWYLRYWLQSVPGVAEVASIGGFQKQYQVNVDPNALLAYNIPLQRVVDAIRQGNNDVGGRVVEFSGTEYMVRGRGYARSVADLEQVAVGDDGRGTPVLVRDVARVALGPDIRRGVVDLDGGVAESDETNNALAGNTVTISKPDLTVASVATTPSNLAAGGTLAVTDSVTSTGGATGGFWVRLYLSADPAITTADTYAGAGWIYGLAAGSEATITVTATIPTRSRRPLASQSR